MDTTIGRDRLREFIDLVVDSLAEDVDAEGIAARGCLSRYHFDRLLSAALHESPAAFRRRLLLERAAWELGRSRDSVTRIALDSGFASVEGFTRAFRRAFGTTPGKYRSSPVAPRLASANGVHFQPPGGLLVPGPANGRRSSMDVIDRLIGHDLWFTNRLLDEAGALPDAALDTPVLRETPLLFGSHDHSLRDILNSMVGNKERWTASTEGRPPPEDGRRSIDGMRERLRSSGLEFQRVVKEIRDRRRWDEGFVDALCDPPQSFTYGGMLSHVLTFSTYRRTLAILAFRELGVENLGIGDPMEWEQALE
jgi:AraC-like DNA-binding protein